MVCAMSLWNYTKECLVIMTIKYNTFSFKTSFDLISGDNHTVFSAVIDTTSI